MYFIARNNKIYNYIAHTSKSRRYFFTIILYCLLGVLYRGLQYLIDIYSLIYKQELVVLDQKIKEIVTIEKNSKKLCSSIENTKKEMEGKGQNSQPSNVLFQQQLFLFLETARQSNVTVNSYSVYKQKDEQGYVKELAHCNLSGAMPAIIQFLKSIKKSETMASLYRWSLISSGNDNYTLQCDIGLICYAKKSLQPLIAEGLGG